MALSRRNWAIVTAWLAVALLPSYSDESSAEDAVRSFFNSTEKNPSIADLESEDTTERGLAYVEMLKQHRQLITELISIVESPRKEYPAEDTRDLAVRLLAEFRSREAIPVLVRNVDYYRPRPESLVVDYKGYSCAKALAAIGPQSVKGIYRHLAMQPPDTRTRERLQAAGQPVRDTVSDRAIELFAKLLHGLHWTEENAPEDVINTVKRHRDKTQYQDDFDRVLAKMEEIADNYRRRKIK